MMDLFFELHSGLPREGPGDNASTKRAFSYLKELPAKPFIVDIGCGPGMQTIQLASLTDGKIIALDIHQPFLDELSKRAKEQGVEEKIEIRNQSMLDLTFDKKSIDVLWAESSIFIYGFEKALQDWKMFLKNRGYFVVSELVWVKSDPPEECRRFWKREYLPMTSIENNIAMIRQGGYNLIQSFEIPKESWMKNYYTPLEKRNLTLQKKYKDDKDKLQFLKEAMKEIQIFKEYQEYIGYVFFILQKK